MKEIEKRNTAYAHVLVHVVVLHRRDRNIPEFKMHVRSDCFSSLNLLFYGVLVAVTVASRVRC